MRGKQIRESILFLAAVCSLVAALILANAGPSIFDRGAYAKVWNLIGAAPDTAR